jgi:uncharacterized membrane protein (DUF106 family)
MTMLVIYCIVHHYCLRFGGGVVHDVVVSNVVHHYCLRSGGRVVHDTVGYIFYYISCKFPVFSLVKEIVPI